MFASDFARKLKKLNKHLKIACGNDSNRPAGLFYVDRYGQEESICGIDKNEIPEWPIMNPNGSHFKAGWRRTLRILLGRGLIDKYEAQHLFHADLNYKKPKKVVKRPDLGIIKQGGY